jgi:D-glycero-D-manno-heptose 1,7-bisphosphate phosphatase
MKQRAVFLDRDGTLVYSSHYPSRPEHLRLYENIGPALHKLQDMEFRLVVITNQSGIARGFFTEADLQHMHDYLTSKLAAMDVHLSGIYHCPHHPAGVIPDLAMACQCRKPQPGMLLRAAEELNLDLAHSWFMGDILDDVEAGNRAGCRTVLVDLGTERRPQNTLRCPTFVARNTLHALQLIRSVELMSSDVDLLYRPSAWQDEQRAQNGGTGQAYGYLEGDPWAI